MALDVTVQVQVPEWKALLRPYCKTVRAACEAAWQETSLAVLPCRFAMAVVLADDAFIHDLNHTYRGKNKPTNVLSFPQEANLRKHVAASLAAGQECGLGDVVLALETVQREAGEQGKSFRHHALHLLVHGTLHLLGYDHEQDSQARRMEKKEIKILEKLMVENPYL